MDQENRLQTWLSQYIKTLSSNRREDIIENIRKASSPGFDYFFLVVLSSAIATLGLINDSAAVIIGAMLVAPLMSPILGVGLGSITADARLARDSVTALIRGAVLSVLLSALLTLSNIHLPFAPALMEIPREILGRTQPTPNDLIIALAGGLAAAYSLSQPHLSAALPGVAIATALMPPLSTIGIGIALGRWDIAGGAALLFITNAITIAFAAILVFFLEGFKPLYRKTNGKLPKSLVITGLLTALLFIPLTILGARLVNQAQENRLINNIIETEISEIGNTELFEINITRAEHDLNIELTVRSNTSMTYPEVVRLQEALVSRLEKPVALIVNHVRADTLDPLLPPTYTPTSTLGPSPTFTPSPTVTTTLTPTPEEPTPTATATQTNTPTQIPPTPTPRTGFVVSTGVPAYYNLYQEPGGPIIARLTLNSPLLELYETMTYEGIIWIKVMDEDGRIGWFPEMYLFFPTATPSPTPTIVN
jgi:uncharacterized hydrophobic protein (TIGR00271 family)